MNSLVVAQARPLNRATLIQRELVHRTSLAEVLLTDVEQVREHVFRAAAQWTRSHPTFDRAGDGRHDPLMVAETLRQLGICIPLRYYPVEPDAHFLIEELGFGLDPATEPKARFAGSEITCEVEASQFRFGRPGRARGGSGGQGEGRGQDQDQAPLQRLHLAVRFFTEEAEFAQAQGFAQILSPATFAAVRRRKPADDPSEHVPMTRLDPRLIGARLESDVLISLDPSGGVRLDPADPYHPFFFDHDADHVPGMVLLEAVRQAATLQAGVPRLRTVRCDLQASRFTEPSPPAHIECAVAGNVCEFEVRQLGQQTASGSLHFG